MDDSPVFLTLTEGGSGLSRQFIHVALDGKQIVNTVKLDLEDQTVRLNAFTVLYYDSDTLEEGTTLKEFKEDGEEVTYTVNPQFPCSLYDGSSPDLEVCSVLVLIYEFPQSR